MTRASEEGSEPVPGELLCQHHCLQKRKGETFPLAIALSWRPDPMSDLIADVSGEFFRMLRLASPATGGRQALDEVPMFSAASGRKSFWWRAA